MAVNLQPLLDKQRLAYKIVRAPDHLPLHEDWYTKTVPMNQLVGAQLLQDSQGFILSLYPASHDFQPAQLQQVLRRRVQCLDYTAQELLLARYYQTNEFTPGVGFDQFQVIVDEALSNQDTIYFHGTNELHLLALPSTDLENLQIPLLLGSRFSEPAQTVAAEQQHTDDEQHGGDLLERITRLEKLPVLPESARTLLNLRDDPNSTVDQLVNIIEQDPSLALQITRYANSALFGLAGQVNTLHDAIFRVLGFDTTLYLSLGISMGRVFKLPNKGPLGQQHFWQHATYSAALCQKLAGLMPKARHVKPAVAYLTGLLHDIGLLLMAMLFKNEYQWLNKMVSANPDEPLTALEAGLFDTTHMQLGQWLMETWHMPEELAIVTAHHHNPDYSGRHAGYVQLVGIVDRLLKTHGLSDADDEEISPLMFETLGLVEEEVYEAVDEVLQGSDTLDSLAHALGA